MKLKMDLAETQEAVIDCLNAGVVPLVKGPPGIGKSDMLHAVAKAFNLKYIDVRLAQTDPVELNGFPDLAGEFATFKPFDIYPIEKTPIPAGYKGWLLSFDELTSAGKMNQAAAYKILLDRMVGQEFIHPACMMVAAGNNMEDKAVVTNMSTALQSRLVHLNMSPSHDEVVDYFIEKHYAPMIPAYLTWKPAHVHAFNPDHEDDTFACPRTWTFINNLIQRAWKGDMPASKKPIAAGTLGLGVANEFVSFCRIWESLPDIKKVLQQPLDVEIPSDPGTRYAIAGMVASHMDTDNADKLMQFVTRLPQSMSLLCVRMAYKGDRNIARSTEVRNFIKENRKDWLA